MGVEVTRPAPAHNAFLDELVAELRVIHKNASIQTVQGLKPFVVPVIIDGGIMDDVVDLLFI